METYEYQGSELEIFARAYNWKAYFGRYLAPYIHGDVLEVGAGLGATARALCDGRQRTWTCLEPDSRLGAVLTESLRRDPLPTPSTIVIGTVANLPANRRFDTILYVDVLEHIEDHEGELRSVAAHLAPGGACIVLAPAFRWLFSDFDRQIGHHRRYSRSELLRIAPVQLVFDRGFYLDAVGALLSLGNRLLLRSETPTAQQIAFWDRVIIPLSRCIDPLIGRNFGRAVVVIWRNKDVT